MRRKSVSLLGAILFMLAAFTSNDSWGQLEFPEDKVSWKFTVEQNGDEATIVGTITCVEGWHINSIVLPEMSFGYATNVTFEPSKNYKKIGKVSEPKPHEVYDEESDETLSYHEGTFKFRQKIKITSTKDFTIKGVFDFQTCNDVRCLKDHQADFTVKVKGVEEEAVDMSNIEATFVAVNGDEAKDKEGQEFVKVNNEWHPVPEGNSTPFYKMYLKLEGSDEK